MHKPLSFEKAVEYLNGIFHHSITGKNSIVTLHDDSQQIRLILLSEDNGKRTSLFVPFLEMPDDPEQRDFLDRQLLHLNADVDALGNLRVCLNRESNTYSLCDGELIADNARDFAEYLQEVLRSAMHLRSELSDGLEQGNDALEGSSLEIIDNLNYLRA